MTRVCFLQILVKRQCLRATVLPCDQPKRLRTNWPPSLYIIPVSAVTAPPPLLRALLSTESGWRVLGLIPAFDIRADPSAGSLSFAGASAEPCLCCASFGILKEDRPRFKKRLPRSRCFRWEKMRP